MRSRILTVSSTYMCLYVSAGSLPLKSQERVGEGYEYLPGGAGAVAAMTFAALGCDSIFCAKTGYDQSARKLLGMFDAAGVDTRFVDKTKNAKTGFRITITEEDMTRRALKFPQANDELTTDDIENAFTSYPDAVFIQREIPDRLILAACNFAHEKNIPVFYQPCTRRGELAPDTLGYLEAVILNECEVNSYCGIEPVTLDKCLTAAIALSARINARYYIMRLPERGAFIYDGKYQGIVPTCPSPEIDTSGSFVVFGAALTSEYIKTQDIRRAALYANAAYALSSAAVGDISSVPTEDDIEKYLKLNDIKL